MSLGFLGVLSWLAGGAAAFLSKNGAGAAALVGAGTICVVFGLMGRWPSRVSVSGNELSWNDVKQTVDSQIEQAERAGEPDQALRQLKSVRARLDSLERTGLVPELPAVTYDDAVESALRRNLPGAEVTREQNRGNALTGFVVLDDGVQLFVEPRWLESTQPPFRGTSLWRVIPNLPSGARLLVVVNTGQWHPGTAKMVEDALAERGRIVTWRDARDDAALADALSALLPLRNKPVLLEP